MADELDNLFLVLEQSPTKGRTKPAKSTAGAASDGEAARKPAAPGKEPPKPAAERPAGEAAIQRSGNFGLTLGLKPAPAEYGADMYVISGADLERIVEVKVQKIQGSLNALKRYMEELESDLMQKEDQLDSTEAQLQVEEQLRQAAEAERDALLQQRAALEAKLVEDRQAASTIEQEVLDMDAQAEEIADRRSRGEISEEEACALEEQLIQAQARRLSTRRKKEYEQVSADTVQASLRAEEAAKEEERLRRELVEVRLQVEKVKAERDQEAERREEADSRFNQLVQRIQAKIGGRG